MADYKQRTEADKGGRAFRLVHAVLCGAVVAATIGFPSVAVAEPMTNLTRGAFERSSGPYDDCPEGYYQAHSGDCVPKPNNSNGDVTAICQDGSHSHSEHPHSSGTCHGHGGVAQICPCNSSSGLLIPGAARERYARHTGSR
jgi:Protein of unknown function (DUF3761)